MKDLVQAGQGMLILKEVHLQLDVRETEESLIGWHGHSNYL